MKLLLLIGGYFLVLAVVIKASDDQVTELPNPITLDGSRLMANKEPHNHSKRQIATPKEQSSSESSEEKDGIRSSTLSLTTAVTPIGVISDTGLPVVDAAVPVSVVETSTRKRRTVTETQKSINIASEDMAASPPSDMVTPKGGENDKKIVDMGLENRKKREEEFRKPVTEPPRAAVTPEGVEKDDGLPEVGLGSRKRRDMFANDEEVGSKNYPVTEPPKSAVTPQGVEKDDGLPNLGLGSRKRRDIFADSEIGSSVTQPPKTAVTPQGVEEDDGLPDIGLGSRKRRASDYASSRARRYA